MASTPKRKRAQLSTGDSTGEHAPQLYTTMQFSFEVPRPGDKNAAADDDDEGAGSPRSKVALRFRDLALEGGARKGGAGAPAPAPVARTTAGAYPTVKDAPGGAQKHCDTPLSPASPSTNAGAGAGVAAALDADAMDEDPSPTSSSSDAAAHNKRPRLTPPPSARGLGFAPSPSSFASSPGTATNTPTTTARGGAGTPPAHAHAHHAHAQPVVDAAIFRVVKAGGGRRGGPRRAVGTPPATFAMSNVGGSPGSVDGKPAVVFGGKQQATTMTMSATANVAASSTFHAGTTAFGGNTDADDMDSSPSPASSSGSGSSSLDETTTVVVEPIRASLTWRDDEITVYDPLDPFDDGTGIDGIGFRPSPAVAEMRAEKRRRQLADYRRREESDARERRRELRARRAAGGGGGRAGSGAGADAGAARGGAGTTTPAVVQDAAEDQDSDNAAARPARRVRFMETESSIFP